MKVRCLSTRLADIPSAGIDREIFRSGPFGITLGRQYLVFGMGWTLEPGAWGAGTRVLILNDSGTLIPAPLALFTFTDPRVSRFWEARCQTDGSLTLWPPSFYREYYIDDLSERVPEVADDFRRVRREIEAEWPDLPDSITTQQDRAVLQTFLSMYWPSGRTVDDAGDRAAVAKFLATEPPEARDRVTAAIVRFLDSPEPEPEKAEFIRAAAWRYLPGGPERPIEWLAGVLREIQTTASGP